VTGDSDDQVRRPVVTERWERLLEVAYWLAALVLGGMQAWPARFQPSTIDAVSYLDLGDAYLHGQWREIVNLYWNPLYSWILGVALAVVRPSAWFEYQLAKLVDFGIYAVCLLAFSWFLRIVRVAYRAALDREGDRDAIPDWIWIVGGYTLFIWSSLRWITLTSNTPDMCATALAYGAWGLALRREQDERRFHYPLLGVLLALGYFSRNPMLIVGLALVLFIGLDHATRHRSRGAILAGAVLLMLTAPYVLLSSYARGHLTIGDNGVLNHAWQANPGSYKIPNRHWQGGPPGYGAPLHPSRMLWKHPPAYEFATPIGGTYPPWSDPSYWYQGLTYHFDGQAEWTSFTHSLQFEYQLIGGRWFLLALVTLLLVASRPRDTLAAVRRNVPYWAPALIGLILYVLADDLLLQWTDTPQPPSRFVAIFNVVAGVMLAASFRARPWKSLAALKPVLATWIVIASLAVISGLAREQLTAVDAAHEMPPWQLARQLEDVGVAHGARVAIIGSPAAHEFWARLARVRIIADVADDALFWAQPADDQALILQLLAQTGAQVVVSQSAPSDAVGRGWRFAPNTGYAVRALTDARGVDGLAEKRD
jgi:hypothetical protein